MLAKKISEFLNGRAPDYLCDSCIAAEVGAASASQVGRITAAFGITSDFTRHPGHCVDCGTQREVIKAGGTAP